MTQEQQQKFVQRVAQEIVYCNCATEGPALKRCEHVSLAESLTAKLAPLFEVVEAGKAMRDSSPCSPAMDEQPYCDECKLNRAWDAAIAKLQEGTK